MAGCHGRRRRVGKDCDVDFVGADGTLAALEVSRGLAGDLARGGIRVAAKDLVGMGDEGLVLRVDAGVTATTIERWRAWSGAKQARLSLW